MCCSAQAKSRKGTTHSNNETMLKVRPHAPSCGQSGPGHQRGDQQRDSASQESAEHHLRR